MLYMMLAGERTNNDFFIIVVPFPTKAQKSDDMTMLTPVHRFFFAVLITYFPVLHPVRQMPSVT